MRGIRLYHEAYGAGRPLLHSKKVSLQSFKQNIPCFAQHCHVSAVDSRVPGKSADKGGSLSFELLADDFAALLTSPRLGLRAGPARRHQLAKLRAPYPNINWQLISSLLPAALRSTEVVLLEDLCVHLLYVTRFFYPTQLCYSSELYIAAGLRFLGR